MVGLNPSAWVWLNSLSFTSLASLFIENVAMFTYSLIPRHAQEPGNEASSHDDRPQQYIVSLVKYSDTSGKHSGLGLAARD